MGLAREILNSKNKVLIKFPYTAKNIPSYFGTGELSDIMSFGFSFVEHADHCVEYILASPVMALKIIREIDAFVLTAGSEHIGELWTAELFVTNRIKDDSIIFSNNDKSVVLDLNLNKIKEEDFYGHV